MILTPICHHNNVKFVLLSPIHKHDHAVNKSSRLSDTDAGDGMMYPQPSGCSEQTERESGQTMPKLGTVAVRTVLSCFLDSLKA